MTYQPDNSESPYLSTYLNFPEEKGELSGTLSRMYGNISYRLNNREIAIYDLSERTTGQKWTDSANLQVPKETFRKIFEIGAINTGVTSTTAHGLTGVSSYTKIAGTAITDTPDNRPIPYADVTAVTDQIEITVNGTNIIIVNGATAPNITSAIVILEYLKN
jgi:hypothetical protein